jgi:hypothetical protein
MGTARAYFGACVIVGEVYVTGGKGSGTMALANVEKYSPLSDTWSVVLHRGSDALSGVLSCCGRRGAGYVCSGWLC